MLGGGQGYAWERARSVLHLGTTGAVLVGEEDRSCTRGGQELAQGRTGAVLVEDRSFTLGEDRSFT